MPTSPAGSSSRNPPATLSTGAPFPSNQSCFGSHAAISSRLVGTIVVS